MLNYLLTYYFTFYTCALHGLLTGSLFEEGRVDDEGQMVHVCVYVALRGQLECVLRKIHSTTCTYATFEVRWARRFLIY